MKLWKKIAIITVVVFIALIVIVNLFIDKYKLGIEAYNRKDYGKAYFYLKQIDSNDKNFADASTKATYSKKIVDSLDLLVKVKPIEKTISNENKVDQAKNEVVMDTPQKMNEHIKGVTPVDIYGNFENKGFEVDKHIEGDGSLFICSSEENGIKYEAKVFCENGVNDVSSIRLTAFRSLPQYNSLEDLKPFLIYGCSIPYEGYDIDKVTAFINNNFNKNNASIVVSNVRFIIYCPTEFLRMIEIRKK